MSLAFAELHMEWEETFEIQSPDGWSFRFETIGDVADWIFRRLEDERILLSQDSDENLNDRITLRLQDAIADVCGLDRNKIDPTVSLEMMIPRENREKIQQAISAHCGHALSPPDDVHPVGLVSCAFAKPGMKNSRDSSRSAATRRLEVARLKKFPTPMDMESPEVEYPYGVFSLRVNPRNSLVFIANGF